MSFLKFIVMVFFLGLVYPVSMYLSFERLVMPAMMESFALGGMALLLFMVIPTLAMAFHGMYTLFYFLSKEDLEDLEDRDFR